MSEKYDKKTYVIIISSLILVASIFLFFVGKRWEKLYTDIYAGKNMAWNQWITYWDSVTNFSDLEKYWSPVQSSWKKEYGINATWKTILGFVGNRTNIYSNDIVAKIYDKGKHIQDAAIYIATIPYLSIGICFFKIIEEKAKRYGKKPIFLIVLFCIYFFPMLLFLILGLSGSIKEIIGGASFGGNKSNSEEDDPVKDADYYRRRKAADDFVFNSAVARNPSNPNKEYSEHLRDYSFAEMHGASGNQSAEYASLKEAARMASSKGDSFSANELSTKADRVFADIVSKNKK